MDLMNLKPGDKHYKAYVGPPNRYDFMGATQFRLLTTLGLRSHHKLLDFGCGSLRAGKLFIPYLNSGNYFGQEPNQWLIDEAVRNELGNDLINLKEPNFSNRNDFNLGFKEKFDFIVAQSIFSHTSRKNLIKGIDSIYKGLSNEGIALITIIEGKNDYYGKKDWVYPGCTSFKKKTISKILTERTKHWRRLYWFHPAQTWFAITKSKKRLPSIIDNFFSLGGEEINSQNYKNQNFIANKFRRSLILRKYFK